MHISKNGFFLFLAIIWVLITTVAFAGEPTAEEMKGWEKDSPYNQLYDPRERERIRGLVAGIKEIVPMKGMSPATVIVLKEGGDEEVMVHLCPSWFIDKKSTGIKKGEELKIRGVWAELDGEDIFMAAKIKKKGSDVFVLKVRLTSDGKPFWIMDPDELARERAETQ
jgi:hypothetical protein